MLFGTGSASVPAATDEPPPASYNQTEIWRKIVEVGESVMANPPDPVALSEHAAQQIGRLCRNKTEVRTVVHLYFDRSVVPRGGVLHNATLLDGRMSMSVEQFKLMGYSILDNGKLQVVNDVPVGPAYSVIEYWGGEKQHKRWHLVSPVEIEPSRNGDPFFMDDKMVAFGAVWKDAARAGEAMATLLDLFLNGVNDGGRIAVPVVLDVVGH